MDPIVSALEVALLPELERRRVLLSEDARFAETKVFSLRHADVVHTIGLTCHPISAVTAEESYSVHVNIIGVSGIGLRGFACWHQPFIIDRLRGYTIYEGMTRPYRLESVNRLDDFLALLPALFSSFERGIRRGRLPSTLRQFGIELSTDIGEGQALRVASWYPAVGSWRRTSIWPRFVKGG